MPTISSRISRALEATPGRTQSGLARACKVSRQAVGAWVKGNTKSLKPENLVAAARYLNVSVEWLAVGEGAMRKADGTAGAESRHNAINDVASLFPENLEVTEQLANFLQAVSVATKAGVSDKFWRSQADALREIAHHAEGAKKKTE